MRRRRFLLSLIGAGELPLRTASASTAGKRYQLGVLHPGPRETTLNTPQWKASVFAAQNSTRSKRHVSGLRESP